MAVVDDNDSQGTDVAFPDRNAKDRTNRRSFFGKMGGAAATLASLAASPSAHASDGLDNRSPAAPLLNNNRLIAAYNMRVGEAMDDALLGMAQNAGNGDELLYPDKGGVYSKGLPHDAFGRVDPTAYQTFKTALTTGRFSDFEKIIMGGTRTLNGPQGGLAFDLEAADSMQFGHPLVPAAPAIAGDQTATELLELYWGSLLRDVAFTDYGSSAAASQAAAELSGLAAYAGPRDKSGNVTTGLLFRGIFPGENLGPYVSQFLVAPTAFGAHPMTQQIATYLPYIDYMTSFGDWLTVQNGNVTGAQNQIDPLLRYPRAGRDLAAFTHVDVLYQAYFMAFLVLGSMGAPLNPGNPYAGSRCENGFGTFGGPDFAGTLTAVATKALNAVWYQKWFVHLRPRPEAAAGQVHLVKSGQGAMTDVKPGKVVLNSVGLQNSYNKYGTWLLSQAFPKVRPRTRPILRATAPLAARASLC